MAIHSDALLECLKTSSFQRLRFAEFDSFLFGESMVLSVRRRTLQGGHVVANLIVQRCWLATLPNLFACFSLASFVLASGCSKLDSESSVSPSQAQSQSQSQGKSQSDTLPASANASPADPGTVSSSVAEVNTSETTEPQIAPPSQSAQAKTSESTVVAAVASDSKPAASPAKSEIAVAEAPAQKKPSPKSDAQDLVEKEAALQKKIDQEWEAIEQFVKQETPENISLLDLGHDPQAKHEIDLYIYTYGQRLSEIACYQQLTQDPESVQEPTVKFLQAYVAYHAAQMHLLGDRPLSEFAKASIQAGSKDPVVQLHHSITIISYPQDFTADDLRLACQTLVEVAPVLHSEKKYPRCFALQAYSFLRTVADKLGPEQSTSVFPLMVDTWTDWLVEASAVNKNMNFAWGRSRSMLFELDVDKQQQVYLAVLRKPGIDPWLVHMFGGFCHSTLGWKYRGGGYANTVTRDGWKKFGEHLKIAKRHLFYAHFLQPQKPETTTEVMKIALAATDEVGTSTEWFLRTVKICFDYREAYEQLEWSLKPRWGGSIPELLALAKGCLHTERFDTMVPTTGLQLLIRTQETELGLGVSVFDDPQVLPALNRYAEALDEATKGQTTGRILLGNWQLHQLQLAALFIHAGEMTQARRVLLLNAHRIHSDPFFRLQHRTEYVVGRALATVPELAERLNQLDEVFKKGADATSMPADFDEAAKTLTAVHQAFDIPADANVAQLEQLSKTVDTKEPGPSVNLRIRKFLLHGETALTRLRQFSANEWVDLTIDNEAPGWEISASKHTITPPDAIELTTVKEPNAYYQIVSLARFKPPYDVQTTVQVTDHLPGQNAPFSGVVLGATDIAAVGANHRKSVGMRTFGVYPGSRVAAVMELGNPKTDYIRITDNQTFVVRVKVWKGGHYRYFVNNMLVVDKVEPQFDPYSEVRFGTGFSMGLTGTTRFSHMRIHKLTQKPPEDAKDLAATEAFASYELQLDPNDAPAQFDLGRSLFLQQKYEPALKSLERALELRSELVQLGLRAILAASHSKLEHVAAALREYAAWQSEGYKSPADVPVEPLKWDYARLLATTSDDQLRQGLEALKIILPLNEQTNFTNWEYLWVLAAAHAECGEFDLAAKRIEESLAIVPAEKKPFVMGLKELFDTKKTYRIDAK